MSHKNKSEQGAVSLFVVIFTALLVTTITISFVQLMVRDQRQAMYSDLSDSAYDSAAAGVEDAKRALLMQQDCLGDSSIECDGIRSAIDSGKCTTLADIFNGGVDETPIVQTEGDARLEQAYTCVKITQNTRDYLGTLNQNSGATVVPLRGVGAFDKVTISWGLSENGNDITLPPIGVVALPASTAWPDSYPALLRVQLINGQDSFRLSQLDSGGFSNTLFLYPSEGGTPKDGSMNLALDGRRDAADGAPQPVQCVSSVASGAYACKMTLNISPQVGARSQTAFLNLMAFYNATDYKIELKMGDDVVPFDGVQPEVDSTGRANDLFRRIISRVELNNSFNYPAAALETRHNICKNFSVTTEQSGYKNNISLCDPVGQD